MRKKMEMTINDIITKYNLLNVLKFEDDGYAVKRELKVKLIRYKLNFAKVKDEYVAFQQQAMEEIQTDEYKTLANKQDKTEEENIRFEKIIDDLNDELNRIANNKANETIDMKSFEPLTEEEFNNILEVNVNNSPDINGNKLDSNVYLELLYSNFVK